MSDKKYLEQVPTLEEPEAAEFPDAGRASLFDESFPNVASKLASIEALFKLLTADMKYNDFMREILLVYVKAVKSEAGSILEVNHKEGAIYFRSAVGHVSDRVVRFVIPLGKGIVGHVADSKQPLVVSDATGHEKHLKSIADACGFAVRNMVAVPILVRGKVYGVVELINRIGEENFTDTDVETLVSLSEYVARAIEIRLMIAWAQHQKDDAA